jgi:type IV pilus assembly protein PilX
MSAGKFPRRAPPAATQRGFILITGLLFLVVITLVAVAMFRGTGLMDRVSANARDKQRSFEAAQSALQYAEWWLGTNKPGSAASACSTLASGDTVSNIHVCSNAIQSDYLSAIWTSGFTYTPPNLASLGGTGTAGGQVSASTDSDVKYYNLPGFYLKWLAYSSTKGGDIYQVTAYGYGGNTTTMTVLRSTYLVPTSGGGGGGGGGLTGP